MTLRTIFYALPFFCLGLASYAQPIEKPAKAVEHPVADSTAVALAVEVDTLSQYKFKLYKKKAHASYYSDKFNGRRTASGQKFSNKKLTAAHRKLPFGTKLKLTNEANGKSVIVEVNDRGPFSKAREIDISKKAFMEITHSKGAGGLNVTIEELIPPKTAALPPKP